MYKLVVLCLMASTTFATPILEARGDKWCDGPDGPVVCSPYDWCGKGDDFGLCCPMDGSPCYVLDGPTSTTTATPSPTANPPSCPHIEPRGEKWCDGPNGSFMCSPYDWCGKGDDFGLCCPMDGSPCYVLGGPTPAPTSFPTPTSSPTADPTDTEPVPTCTYAPVDEE